MKKVLCLLIIAILMLASVYCTETATAQDTKASTNSSMFVMVENNYAWNVVYHKDTKVMYVISRGSHNQGTFTVMLDADGKPLLWEG